MEKNDFSPRSDFFQCLFCAAEKAETTADFWRCQSCGRSYRVEAGIPLLVRNLEEHTTALEQARAVKPGWYLEEQPPEETSPWRHHLKKRRLFVEARLAEYLAARGGQKAETLLDLGCGDGNHLPFLQKYAERLYASDYNPIRLARTARRGLPVSLFMGDICDFPCRDNFFDVIFFNHVIEHIPADTQALKTLQRILKPGGLLILGTPNEGAAWWRLAYQLQPQTLKTTDHVHFYTAQSLKAKMTAAGFQVGEVAHLGWSLPHWGLDARIRKYQWVDDLFDFFGRRLIPTQSTSLYALATKREGVESR